MTGTTLSQIIPIFTAPIITRIYLPEYYGIMAIYMSVSTLLGIISTLSYTSAILLPEKDEDAISVLQLCFISTLIWAGIVLFAIIFIHGILAVWLKTPEVSKNFGSLLKGRAG